MESAYYNKENETTNRKSSRKSQSKKTDVPTNLIDHPDSIRDISLNLLDSEVAKKDQHPTSEKTKPKTRPKKVSNILEEKNSQSKRILEEQNKPRWRQLNKKTNQRISQPTNESVNQQINQSTNQSFSLILLCDCGVRAIGSCHKCDVCFRFMPSVELE